MASVLIPLAEGFEDLEAITVVDLLRRAGIEVVTAGLTEGPIKAARGTVVLPDATLEQALSGEYDMVVLPGGLPGADHLDQDPRIQSLLRTMAAADKYTAAICAAPKVLASAGLLEGKRATSYPGALDGTSVPGLRYEQSTVVVDGKVITSRGPGTAMDFALALIEALLGCEKRNAVEGPLQRPSAA